MTHFLKQMGKFFNNDTSIQLVYLFLSSVLKIELENEAKNKNW